MSGPETTQPRWGNLARSEKATSIRDTLVLILGPGLDAGSWLDVGCGSGGIAATLASDVSAIIGIDPEPWSAWEQAMSERPNLSLVSGKFDAPDLPVREGSIDVVVCNQVYEHVTDPKQLILNLRRAMAPGGVCYFAGPNLLWPVEPHVFWPFVHWLPRRLAKSIMRTLGSRQAEELDAYSSPSWVLRRWFRQNGFEVRWAFQERLVVELASRGHRHASAFVSGVPRWMFLMIEPFAPAFVYVLRNKVTSQVANG